MSFQFVGCLLRAELAGPTRDNTVKIVCTDCSLANSSWFKDFLKEIESTKSWKTNTTTREVTTVVEDNNYWHFLQNFLSFSFANF